MAQTTPPAIPVMIASNSAGAIQSVARTKKTVSANSPIAIDFAVFDLPADTRHSTYISLIVFSILPMHSLFMIYHSVISCKVDFPAKSHYII